MSRKPDFMKELKLRGLQFSRKDGRQVAEIIMVDKGK